mgnify:CR=1 FL=1
MIKAAIKSLIFVAVITLISFAATLFMQANNDLKIVLTDIEIILSPLATVIIGIFSIISIWLLFKIFNTSFLNFLKEKEPFYLLI